MLRRIPFFFIFVSTLTFAQDAEIVVTATKEPTAAQTLPVSVQVLNQDELRLAQSLADAFDQLDAFRVVSGTGLPYLTSGAFGENGFGRVLLLLDGFSQNNPDQSAANLNFVPLFAVERIEALEGPSSAVYGDAAVAGVVRVVTKIPRRFSYAVSAEATQTWTNAQGVDLGVPWGDGGLLLSFHRDQNVPGQDRTASSGYSTWGKVAFPSIAAQRYEVWGSWNSKSFELPGGLTKTQFESNPNQAKNAADSNDLIESRAGIQGIWEGESWTVTVPSAVLYRNTKATVTSFSNYSINELVSWEFEPRWRAEFDTSPTSGLSVVTALGGSWKSLQIKRYSSNSFQTQTMDASIQRPQGQIGIEATHDWGQRIFVTATARQEWLRTSAVSATESYLNQEKWFAPFSGQAGVTFVGSSSNKFGLQVARVFRYPFVDEMVSAYGYGSDYFSTTLEPEIGHSISATGNADFGFATFRAHTTLTKMENEVVVDGATYRNVNGGPSLHWNSKASIDSLDWNDPLVGKSKLGVTALFEQGWFLSDSHYGKSIPLIPGQTWKFWYKGTFFERFVFQSSWKWSAQYWEGGDYANAKTQIPGRQTVDIDLAWNWVDSKDNGTMTIALKAWGHNLLDDRTPTQVYFSGWYPVEARSFGAAVSIGY